MHVILSTLKQLAIIDHAAYGAKFIRAKTAIEKIELAKVSFNNNDYFSAYLLSHHSYHLFPYFQAKELLVTTGKELIDLLNVQFKIDQSFKLSPKLIDKQLNKYKNQPISEWNLFEVNSFIEKLNYNSKTLQESINILKSINHDTKKFAKSQWQKDLKKQKVSMTDAKEIIIGIAQNVSASILLSINENLLKKSTKMLSLVNLSSAQQNLQPIFLKAQVDYFPFQTLIENLSLADANNYKGTHSPWYKNWSKIENDVLNFDMNLLDYPHKTKIVSQQLLSYLNKYDKSNVLPKIQYQNLRALNKNHQEIQLLIKKLSIDKVLINYGLPKNHTDNV